MDQRPLFQILFTGLYFFSVPSYASSKIISPTHVQPTEVIEAKPIASFSEDTASWPAQSYSSQILHTPARSVFESLNSVTGVETRGSLSKGSPAITLRGSNSATRTLLLYDGIPLNLADGIGAQELLIPRETLAQVNVLKGPSSVYYGAGAMAGALNFVPEFYNRSRVRVTGGSFGERSAFGAASLVNDDRNQVVATAFHENIDGDYPYFSPASGKNGVRDRTDTHTERATLSGNHVVEGYRLGYRMLLAREYGSSPGSIHSPDPTRARKSADLYALRGSKDFSNSFSASLSSSFIETQSHFLTERTDTQYDARASQWSQGLSITYRENNELIVTGIMSAKQNEMRSSALQWNKKQEDELDPGLLIQFPFADDMWLQSGARYLPKYGVVVKALGINREADRKRFWVTFSEGFRPASLSDKHDQSSTFQGNPYLKPEESDQIEIGASQEGLRTSSYFFNRLSYEVSAYSTNYENLIVYNDNSTSKINKQFSRAWGADLEAAYPIDLWSFGANYSYLDASSQGQPLAYTTEQKVSAIIAHYFGPVVFEFRNSTWINYQRSTRNDDKESWNTSDLTFRSIGLSDWVFSGGVTNMFDASAEYIYGYPEPRKRYFLSIERLF